MCWRRTSGGSGGPRPTILRCGSWFLLRGKIDRFLAKVKEAGRFDLGQQDDPQAILQKLGYITHDQPAWAAMLLFARDPLRHHIHIGRFKTPSHIIDDRQFTDTLFEVTEQAMKFIVSHLSVAFEFDGSVQRKERFSYPLPALREALVNAIVHRDYTDGSDIQIKIFDDRITIYSPGRLYGGLRLEDLHTNHYPSKLRNKLVAEAFYLTGNIEKYGSGFIRIRKALEDYPEVRLEIRESGHGLLLSFLKVALQRESKQVTDQVTDQVTPEVLRLLTAMRGPMTRGEIQSALGLKHLPHLRDAYLTPAIKQGLLEMTIPEKPQSRLQKYRQTPAGKTLAERINAGARSGHA
jgi:ATP-dependent DNA helicase RecG